MKRAFSTTIALVAGLLMICLVGCRKTRRGYSVSQIKQMEQFAAKVTDVTVEDWTKHEKGIVLVLIVLKKDDGSELSIVETRATSEQVAFAHQLTVGHTYTFPQVIVDHETTSKPKSP